MLLILACNRETRDNVPFQTRQSKTRVRVLLGLVRLGLCIVSSLAVSTSGPHWHTEMLQEYTELVAALSHNEETHFSLFWSSQKLLLKSSNYYYFDDEDHHRVVFWLIRTKISNIRELKRIPDFFHPGCKALWGQIFSLLAMLILDLVSKYFVPQSLEKCHPTPRQLQIAFYVWDMQPLVLTVNYLIDLIREHSSASLHLECDIESK
jgi:hypothetical protein